VKDEEVIENIDLLLQLDFFSMEDAGLVEDLDQIEKELSEIEEVNL
jgi:hypothetical protein